MKLVVLAASFLLAPRVDPPVLEIEGIHRTVDRHDHTAVDYTPIAGTTFGFAF